ncbi:MAG: phosphopantetheine-binding protein, partial [Ardenticatenaceae bacterium]
SLQSRYPQMPKLKPEELGELRTLGQIVNHTQAAMGVTSTNGAAPSPNTAPAAAPAPVAAPPAATSGVNTEELTNALLEVVSDKTGYPVEMLELEMDIESDLGIDSIKRVEILGSLQSRYPQMPKLKPEELGELRTLGQIVDHTQAAMGVTSTNGAAPSASTAPAAAPAPVAAPPAATSGVNTEELTNALLEVVSNKTGYPVEMLELEMDIESDLGIDSIKRVEILGSLQSR